MLKVNLGSVLESEFGQKWRFGVLKGMFMLKVVSSEKKQFIFMNNVYVTFFRCLQKGQVSSASLTTHSPSRDDTLSKFAQAHLIAYLRTIN